MTRIDHSPGTAYLYDGPLVFRTSDTNQGEILANAGPPASGTSGTGAGVVNPGALCVDGSNGVVYFNEGTRGSPYWTPTSFHQSGIFGVYDDFRGLGAGKALADTAATATLASGLRVFGQGIEVNGDSGLVAGAGVEGQAALGVLHVTDEVSHLSAIGTDAGIMQPDQHERLVVDVEFTDNVDILTSSVFLGFVGTAANALDPALTGATTVATFVQDDLCGLYSDSSMTDVDGVFAVAEKSNVGGTQTGLTAVADRAAAGTYQRWRIEVGSTGIATAFVNKVQVATIPGATGANTHSTSTSTLDADEEVSPVFYVENSTTTTRTANIKRFAAWGSR